METAQDRFFNTPELLDLVTTTLEPTDISRLCRTSHRIHECCTPALYRDLFISSLYGREQKILASTPCLLALGRNVRHVRKLTLGTTELHYYYNCLLAFEEIRALDPFSLTATPTLSSASSLQLPPPLSPPLFLPPWLPPEDDRTCRVVPVPPITNLHSLELTYYTLVDCSYELPHHQDERMIMAEFSWLISLNPRLETLESSHDGTMDLLGYRLLGKAIAGLSHLTTLDLLILCDNSDQRFKAGAEIFFNCCPSIRKFVVATESFSSTDEDEDDFWEWDLDGVPEDAEWRVQSRKQEPLTNLVEIELWEVVDSTSTDELLTVFARCPNLRKLNILNFPSHLDHVILGDYIGRECPKIRSLICGSHGDGGEVCGPVLLRILESLPRQTVEDIGFFGSYDSFTEFRFTLAILRHSTTLTTIELEWAGSFVKISVSALLGECVNLKELHIRSSRWIGHTEGFYTTLTDILERQWVTTQLKDLTLFVSVCDQPVAFQEQQVVISQMREAHFKRLEELKRRVMALPEIERVQVEPVVVAIDGENQQLTFIRLDKTPFSR